MRTSRTSNPDPDSIRSLDPETLNEKFPKLPARACLESLQEGLSGQLRLGKLLGERVKLRQELLGLTQRALVGTAHREHKLKPAHL
jgi:hypothetical protein